MYSVYTAQNDTAQNVVAKIIVHRIYSVYTARNDTAHNVVAIMILHTIYSVYSGHNTIHKISMHRKELPE